MLVRLTGANYEQDIQFLSIFIRGTEFSFTDL